MAEHIDVSPRGDRAIANVREIGLINIEIRTDPDSLVEVQRIGDVSHHMTTVDSDYAPDASRFYSLSESRDTLSIYDFSDADAIAVYSGDGQSGVVNEDLPGPLRVQVTGTGGPAAGIPVNFSVTSGGGRFAASDSTVQTVSTDAGGIAEAYWVLGPDIGAGSQTAEGSAAGLSGSPCVFTANGLTDPDSLPLTVTGVTPDSGATGISLVTALQTTFSRAVDPSTVTDTTLFLHAGGFYPVLAAIGFADDDRRVSLTPLYSLDPDAIYWIEMTTGILDAAGGPLDEAVSSSFTSQSAPALDLGSIRPASGTEGASVVVSGAGFNEDPELNKILFGESLEAFVTAGGTDFLSAIVPTGAVTCSVRIVNAAQPGDTSRAVGFTVVPEGVLPLNNVVGSVVTSSATRSVSITPDGAIAYAVSPDADKVSVIDLVSAIQIASVGVGENPVAVTIDPEGAYAYVANYIDGTVSVIDADGDSPFYNQIVDAFAVGIGPTDLAVAPDGDRLMVANAVSGGISSVDTDPVSVTYRSVVSSISTGSGTRSVAITPDGGLIYVGTDTGYTVISATSYGVVSSIATGGASQTVAITPDGGLLVLLTTEGVVNIYDIQENSLTKDQVVGSVRTASGTSTIAISPDGGFLYMIQEAGDAVMVGMISINISHGVIGEGAELPPPLVEVTMVDTLIAGEDPAAIAFDPSGSGNIVVTNAGDYTVTIFGEDPGSGTGPAEVSRTLRSFPNPFSQTAKIRFAVSEAIHVHMAVYDVRGRLVSTIINKKMGPGIYTVEWNGTDRHGERVASGLYFCRLVAGEHARTRKMMLLR